MKIRHVDHIGINVVDLEAAKRFFVDLGFKVVGEMKMQGDLLDGVTGLKGARTEFAMLQAPDDKISLEIIKYIEPVDPEGVRENRPNTLGMRHVAFEVEGLDEIVSGLQKKGYGLVGNVENYENVWKTCYAKGPEGIIVEFAERLKG